MREGEFILRKASKKTITQRTARLNSAWYDEYSLANSFVKKSFIASDRFAVLLDTWPTLEFEEA